MGWSGPEGQIIGLKRREREAAARHDDLERRIRRTLATMRRHRQDDLEGSRSVLRWAVEQLEGVLNDQEVQPLARRRPAGSEGERPDRA